MLSKSQIKFITSLQLKKYRKEHLSFVVEGVKTIKEFLNSSYKISSLYVTDASLFEANLPVTVVSEQQMKKITSFRNPSPALAVFEMRQEHVEITSDDLIIGLDDVRDPGNLGTIIRLCDWFGIATIVCSENTVDCYNPKVIQASMGSLTRVSLVYTDLKNAISQNNLLSYGTFMDGDNIYQSTLQPKGIVIFGNEANGINANLEELIDKRISIPRFGKNQATESLNVAMATSIVLSEFKRGSTTEK